MGFLRDIIEKWDLNRKAVVKLNTTLKVLLREEGWGVRSSDTLSMQSACSPLYSKIVLYFSGTFIPKFFHMFLDFAIVSKDFLFCRRQGCLEHFKT